MTKVSAFAEKQAAQLLEWWPERRQLGRTAGELLSYWEQFQAYLVITAVALIKIVKKYNKLYSAAEPLDALGILRSYPYQNATSSTQRALRSLLTMAPHSPADLPEKEAGGAPFTCGICRSIFTDPVILACGSRFCRRCIAHVLDAKRPCPACRCWHPLDVDKSARAKWLAEIIQSQVSAESQMTDAESQGTDPPATDPEASNEPVVWAAKQRSSIATDSNCSSSSSNSDIAVADQSVIIPAASLPAASQQAVHREVLTHPEATPSAKSPATHATVLTYLASYPHRCRPAGSGAAPRRTAMLGAFLRAHRHVGLIALQEAYGAASVGEQALPDHACLADGAAALALFWHRPQFELVTSGTVAAGPEGRPTLLWARLKWLNGRRVKSLAVATCKAEDGDLPSLQAALHQLQADLLPEQVPLLLCGHFPASVASALGRDGGLRDCFQQRGRPVPATTVAGPPEARDWLLSHGTVKVQRIQLVDFMYEGHPPPGHLAVYAEYMALTARSRPAASRSA
eukprot:GGOE01004642.1.p1 GENE.GGOE01004642.1~~GGOE01004642.1.p1  ORF type:complete len:576 (-),score=129.61 GGOE01004642.1:1199-2740(-)